MNLADKTALNILSQSSGAFLLMASSVVMVRHFSKAEYGTFLQVMLIVNTTIMFSFLGLPQSIYYFYQRASNRSHFLVQSLLLSMCIGFLGSIIAYCLRNEFAGWLNNQGLAEYGFVIFLLILFRAPSFLREPILISHDSLILNSLVTLICNLLFYVPLIVGALFSVSLNLLLNIMIVSCGIEFCLYIALMLKVFWQAKNFDSSKKISKHKTKDVSLKDQLIYSLPIGISSYLGVIGKQIDQYIVSVFFSPKDFAVYSRGAMRIPVIANIQLTINNIMMPQYVNAYRAGDIDTFVGHFHLCIEKVAKIKFPVFSLLFALSPSLVTLLYTKDYIEASHILRVYLFYLISSITVYTIIPRASGKTKFIMHATVIAVLSNIALSLWLVSMFGPIGAAVATIISSILMASCLLLLSCRILGVSFSRIFPWSHLAKLLLVSLIASLPIYVVGYFYHPEGMKLLLLILMDTVIYLYCCVFLLIRLGLIYSDDMDFLKRWLRFDVKRWLHKLTFSG